MANADKYNTVAIIFQFLQNEKKFTLYSVMMEEMCTSLKMVHGIGNLLFSFFIELIPKYLNGEIIFG